MGGAGSGRSTTRDGKAKAEESLPLDVRRLHRDGLLTPGTISSWQWVRDRASIQLRSGAGQVTLHYGYRATGRPAEAIHQVIMLETTPCSLGGSRPWFRCPECSRRVAVIYGSGRLFACRQCKRLTYSSQCETEGDRAARQANRIRRQLGWPAGIFNGPGLKPKGMHWRTYRRLVAEHERLTGVILNGIARTMGFVNRLPGKARDSLNQFL